MGIVDCWLKYDLSSRIKSLKYYIMKLNKISLTVCYFFISFNCFLLTAQHTLNIHPELKANSSPIKIKRKGISAIGKYEFDQYKLISGKVGWTTTKRNTSFRSNTKVSSENKKSFVFVNNSKDSVIVNMATSSNVEILVDSLINISLGDMVSVEAKNNFFNRTFFNWNGRTLNKGSEICLGNFIFLKNNINWNFLMVSPIMVEVDGNYQLDTITKFNAALSNGTTEIEIKKISEIEGTKFSLLRGPAMGYEFYLNKKPIAALQYHTLSMDKLFIWFHNELDEDMKFVIATTATALLVKQF